MFGKPPRVTTLQDRFFALMRAHLDFKHQLEEDLRRGRPVDVEQLRAPASSPLGRWIQHPPAALEGRAEWFALSDALHEFHQISAALVASLQRNGGSLAGRSLSGIASYEQAALQVALALRALLDAAEEDAYADTGH